LPKGKVLLKSIFLDDRLRKYQIKINIKLKVMKQHINQVKHIEKESKKKPKIDFPAYPSNPESEDIYNQDKKESNVNLDEMSRSKTTSVKNGIKNEKDFEDDMSGYDLDVPGSELDDQQESIGSEDEENNYYSLGGDNHNDLEEDNG